MGLAEPGNTTGASRLSCTGSSGSCCSTIEPLWVAADTADGAVAAVGVLEVVPVAVGATGCGFRTSFGFGGAAIAAHDSLPPGALAFAKAASVARESLESAGADGADGAEGADVMVVVAVVSIFLVTVS
jgi:hypothetical protein